MEISGSIGGGGFPTTPPPRPPTVLHEIDRGLGSTATDGASEFYREPPPLPGFAASLALTPENLRRHRAAAASADAGADLASHWQTSRSRG